MIYETSTQMFIHDALEETVLTLTTVTLLLLSVS